jgi:putative mRNA 3-end processing factor
VSAIDATRCETVYLTHGYTASFSRYLAEIGFDAHEVHTLYGGEEEGAPPAPGGKEQDASGVDKLDNEITLAAEQELANALPAGEKQGGAL